MLRGLGLGSAGGLFDSIHSDILLKRPLDTPAALSEVELLELFESMAAKNSAARRPSFLGAGAYAHYAPTIIDSLIQRSEFFTAYTPYQPEISQGTLQVIFEFQTLVCQLTGMDVANASMYDGSTALAEAVLMAQRVTRRPKVIVSSAVHPEYLQVADTEAVSFGLLRSPGSCGADIVVAEGQSFGVPLSFGGPYVGLFATLDKYARQIPGRLVGEAYDKKGRRGFVLTLATREQHIRREKATSNICTNEGLIALAATVYLETMGRRGVQEAAKQSAQKAAYAARAISG